MPNYDYRCIQCGKIEERIVMISKKDDPYTCTCEMNAEMKRLISIPPAVVHDTIHPIRRAGTEWNDVLKRIEKNSARANNIEHY